MRLLGFVFLFLFQDAIEITADQAKDHIGKYARVKGKVIKVHTSEGKKGKTVFMNFEKPYPNSVFTAVIFPNDLPNFDKDLSRYENKTITITGMIGLYKDRPQIVVRFPEQIK